MKYLLETVNTDNLSRLCSLSYEQFLDLVPKNTEDIQDEKDFENNRLIIYRTLKNYKKLLTNNELKVFYKRANNFLTGRQYANGIGLQSLRGDIRGLLVNGIYYDYDMVNCQVSILLYLCKEHNVSNYKELKQYVEDREEKLSELMEDDELTRAEAKNLFIKSMFDKNLIKKKKNQKIKNTFFLKYDKTIKNIIKDFYNRIFKDRNTEPNYKNEWNKEGSFMSYILAEMEDKILTKINEKFPPAVKMFDGFYSKEKINIDELNDLSQEYGVQWIEKPLNLSLLEKFNSIEPDGKISIIGKDLLEISKILLNGKLKNKIIRCDNSIYFKDELKYIQNEKKVNQYLFEFITKCSIYVNIKDDNYLPVHSNIKPIHDLTEFILKTSPVNDSFRDDIWNNTKSKIYFRNGYLDFKNNKFIENDKERLTFGYIDRDFIISNNQEIRKEIYEKVFKPIFSIRDNEHSSNDHIRNQLLNNFLYRLKRMMGGNIEDKEWLVIQGQRNSGKSVMGDLTYNAFSNYYIKFSNAENFLYNKNRGADEAKNNSFLLNYEFCKLVITQEVSNIGNPIFCGNKIKKFTSGGDSIEARQNYQDERNFKLQGGLMVCCNDFPDVSPTDTKEFMKLYELTSKFIKENEPQKYNNISYYIKDNSIKEEFIKRDDVLNEYINIIFESKNIEFPKSLYEEFMECEDLDDDKLLNLFEITENENDKITNDELKSIKNIYKITFTLKKIKTLLKGIRAKDYRNNHSRGLSGLKFKNED